MLSSNSFKRDAPFPPGGTPPMPRCGYMDMIATPQLYALLLMMFEMATGPRISAVAKITAVSQLLVMLKDVV